MIATFIQTAILMSVLYCPTPSENILCSEEGKVRLVDGLTPKNGKLEICRSKHWSSVCNTIGWGQDEALIVCKELGYHYGRNNQTGYGRESGLIIYSISCSGDETRLIDCSYTLLSSCSNLVGVTCSVGECNETAVRLVDGVTNNTGRVEICYNGVWDSVCDDHWDVNMNGATVVCHQLGYNGPSIPLRMHSVLSNGSLFYHLDNVNCTGVERRLSECRHNGVGVHNCRVRHDEAGVNCFVENECNETSVRLVNNTSPYHGEVEVCYNGLWFTVCSNDWGVSDAKVVCRQLGYEGESHSYRGISKTSNFSFDDTYCLGNESLLIECRHRKSLKSRTCKGARVLCNDRECKENDIKLVGGRTSNQGKLEVCAMGEWSPVCDEGWHNLNAKIACQQLGYSGVSYPLLRQNNKDINYYLMGGVNCIGNESIITECPNNGNIFHQCDTRPAGVLCTNRTCEDGSIHLVGTNDPSRGRVQYCYNGTWYSVCGDGWSSVNGYEARAVCHLLGYDLSQYGSAVVNYGQGDQLPQLSISCETGTFSQCSISELVGQCHKTAGIDCIAPCVTGELTDCARCNGYASSCRNEENNCRCGISCLLYGDCCSDYSVVEKCDTEECKHGSVNLMGGLTNSSGRIEFCAHGIWGRVCDSDWELDNARVVCRQLGFSDRGVCTLKNESRFGISDKPAVLQDVYCAGTEQEILHCSHTRIGYHGCHEYATDYIIISCYDEERGCKDGEVRLQGGSDPSNGYVEICKDRRWGRVCRDGWDITAAQIMCRDLNYSSGGAMLIRGPLQDVHTATFFGRIKCDNTAKHLHECTHHLIPQNHNCSGDMAAIACHGNNNIKTCKESMTTTSLDGYLRYGECSVYESVTNVCEGILEPGTDYVYVSHKLGNQKTISSILNERINKSYIATTIQSDLLCVDKVYKTLCHYYLPPCGNATKRVPPTSVCINKCQTTKNECSIVWNAVQSALKATEYSINCSANVLFPVKHCCSELENASTIVLPYTSGPTSVTQTKDIGGIITGIFVTILLLTGLLIVGTVGTFIFMSKRQKHNIMNRVQQDILAMNDLELSASNKGSNNIEAIDEGAILTTTLAKSNTYINPGISIGDDIPRARVASYHMRELVRGQFLVKRDDITLLECIGEGEFGIIYKAKLRHLKREFAVKTVKGEFAQFEVDKFVEESLKLSRFKHSHVMNLVGVCLDAGSAPYIIMPYMANGSLLSFLKRERKKLVITEIMDDDNVTEVTKRLMVMCSQIASGMEYLAAEKYIHRDLACRNCMIDTHFLIKITDFGLSEDIFERNYFRQDNERDAVKLPIKWMAPESLSDGHFSEKSDVWSYGVTMWEIFSGGKAPYPGTDPLTLIQSLEQGNRMPQPYNSACNEEIYGIMKSCWEIVPDERPSFKNLSTTVVKYIERIAGYLQIGFNPFSDKQDKQDGCISSD